MTHNNFLNRRDFWLRTSSLVASLGLVRAAYGEPIGAQAAQTAGSAEISHSSAEIHQEVAFAASVARVYQALTAAEQFDKVVQLSAAMNSDMKKMLGAAPTQIDAKPGGAFMLLAAM